MSIGRFDTTRNGIKHIRVMINVLIILWMMSSQEHSFPTLLKIAMDTGYDDFLIGGSWAAIILH